MIRYINSLNLQDRTLISKQAKPLILDGYKPYALVVGRLNGTDITKAEKEAASKYEKVETIIGSGLPNYYGGKFHYSKSYNMCVLVK